MARALFVDTHNRGLGVMTVSVTEVPEKGLVLRFGAWVGPLWELTKKEPFEVGLPFIVPVRGYSARSSAGFVEVKAPWHAFPQKIIEVQGMPWMRNKALAVCSSPVEAVVLQPGAEVQRIATHTNRGEHGRHSNPETARAAGEAIAIQAGLHRDSVFVLEGQSDYVDAWRVIPSGEEKVQLEWPLEHREDRFSDEAFLKAALRAIARREHIAAIRQGGQGGVREARLFLHLCRLAAGAEMDLPYKFENLPEVAESLANKMRGERWQLSHRMDHPDWGYDLQALQGGEVVFSAGTSALPVEVRRALIEASDALTREERQELFEKLEK